MWLAAAWTVAGSAVAMAVPSVRHLRAEPPKDPIPVATISVRK
jgi:hypothetical protein